MFIKSIAASLAFAVLTLGPLSAFATENLCGKHLPAEMAMGEYTIKFLPGSFFMMGRAIPMQGDTSPAEIFMMDGKLVLTSTHDFHAEFSDQNASFEDWWPEDNVISEINLDKTDIALCQTKENLPRLLANATGGYLSNDGIKVKTTLGLLVYKITSEGISANGFLTGKGSYNGQDFSLKAPIEITPR